MIAWLRSLDPRLPRSVYTLQLGGLCNAFGNGLVLPFTFIYLYNVRGMGTATVGLIVATNAVVSIVAGPAMGTLIDRVGGRRMLAVSLLFLAVGYSLFPFVTVPWQGFVASAITGIGIGGFYPAQSTLIAGLTPPERRPAAFAMQRVVMNLGIGLGALAGGLVATTDSVASFTVLFVGDAATFLVYLAVLYAFVPEPARASAAHGARSGRYGEVLRHRAFMGVLAINTLFILAGFSGFELLPVYAKNEAGVSEHAIGLVFLVNTIVIVALQLPIAKLAQGHRRMRTLALLGVLWAASWALVPLAGWWVTGAAAALLLAFAMSVFAVGECLHGAVQAPLVADLADHRLIGRYMALSALSWQVGFALGPAVGGFVLGVSPVAVWFGAAAVCLATSAAALALEPSLPTRVRRTPVAAAEAPRAAPADGRGAAGVSPAGTTQ
ncbi:MAG TPA: MFS transporter [Gaiellaceae bacterium]|nr:MFS transporter [Gaiellaceae bacterium]